MMYANLNEVYGSSFGNSNLSKKKKKKNIPLETKEMETELLSKKDMNEFKMRNTPQSRVSRLGINPFDPFNTEYGNINNMNNTLLNENAVGPNNPFNHPYSMYHYIMNDPDYRDFLVYKKMKNSTNSLYEPFMNRGDSNDFDQLLLYIFTGLFILIMFDNIYKLGVNL